MPDEKEERGRLLYEQSLAHPLPEVDPQWEKLKKKEQKKWIKQAEEKQGG